MRTFVRDDSLKARIYNRRGKEESLADMEKSPEDLRASV